MAPGVAKSRDGGKKKDRTFQTENQLLEVQNVTGHTSLHNRQFARCPITSNLAYLAGCIVVAYNPTTKIQSFFTAGNLKSFKPLSSVCYSHDGKYIAAGETGNEPAINIWDVKTGKRW